MKHGATENRQIPDHAPDAARRVGTPWWIETGLIVAFWGFIILLTIGQRALDPRHGSPRGLMPGEALQAMIQYGAWTLLTPGIFWLSRRFRLEGRTWLRHLLFHLLVALCVADAIDLVTYTTFRSLVAWFPLPPVSLAGSITGLHFLDDLIVYLVVLSAGFARDYFLRSREHMGEASRLRTHAAELQAQLAEARLHSLRMQVNPHFLFNTLHAVAALVERDPKGVRRMIARLSELLRYALDETTPQEVALLQEMKFIRVYLEIQQIRFQGRLDVRQEIDPEVLEALLPNLILQPLVENAVKHGTSRSVGEGRITIHAGRDGDNLVVSIHDNGPGPSQGDGSPGASRGIGLRNTRERLESLYGPGGRVTLEAQEGGGCVAQIVLPFHTAADLRTVGIHAHE